MEPVTVKFGKRDCVFHTDRLEIFKKGKIRGTIHYREVKKMTYNPKFGLRDLLYALSGGYALHVLYHAFVMHLYDYSRRDWKSEIMWGQVLVRMSNDDFERVKNVIPMEIEIL